MKHTLLIAVAFVLSIAFVSAQTDTTRNKTKTKSTTKSRSTTQRSDSTSAWYSSYPTKDMTKVQSADIPASLRTTLQGSDYKGWESGTLYRNSRTNEYSLQLPNSANRTNTRNNGWYRFDQQGKVIPDTQKPQME